MERGSTSGAAEKGGKQKGRTLGSVLPNIEPFRPRKNSHDPGDLKSWAKKTGFVSTAFSGESERGGKVPARNQNDKNKLDLEKGLEKEPLSPTIEVDPILGRTRKRGFEIEQDLGSGSGVNRKENDGLFQLRDETMIGENHKRGNGMESNKGVMGDGFTGRANDNAGQAVNDRDNLGRQDNGHGVQTTSRATELKNADGDGREREVGISNAEDPSNGGCHQSPSMKCGMRENPGYVPLIFYGLQHFLSLAGSLVFIPLIMVPTMGGSDKDMATVISTMLFVSGTTTILNSYLGTCLPLVQGSSFVYLAPALAIMNSQEYRNLTEHKFRHIMRELQGAVIVSSILQSILGFSGLISLLLRLINPIVVAPTIAAVGLAFFSYGFPQAGSCVEISLPQILLVLIFTLYLQRISIFGNKIFQIYAVPLSVIIVWAYAFFLTAGGAYNYKGCNPDIPSSNILIDACRKHAYTMKHCRTDVSNAMRTAAWVRIPYPLQWGIPIFRLRTSIIMIFVSLVASVDSIGTYHSASKVINLMPPTPGIVSRGIGLEGFSGILAGLWGSGTGSTTLTENIHTIGVTKVASRKGIQLGALFMIIFSFIGKIGAILASIPLAMAAAVLCFTWALVVALGLSMLQDTQASSFRNMMIVGASLFLGLSIPAYVQQSQPESIFILPGFLIPYAAASDGPIRSGSSDIDFALNALLSLNMVVTFLVAFVLDNTVPGSRQERGVYKWSRAGDLSENPSLLSDYSVPHKLGQYLRWAKCLGMQQ